MSSDPATIGRLSRLGFDWMCLDAQHGHFDDRAIDASLAARRDDTVPVHVRVAAADPWLIGRALDSGAAGIIVPMVNTADEAAAVVSAAYYPPIGVRSWGPFLGAVDRAVLPPAEANVSIEISVMIETADALHRVEEIAATSGIHGLFVGPFDLAIALGIELDDLLADTTEQSPLRRIVSATERQGIVAGAFAGSPERATILIDHGFTFVAVATDEVLMQLGARAALN